MNNSQSGLDEEILLGLRNTLGPSLWVKTFKLAGGEEGISNQNQKRLKVVPLGSGEQFNMVHI